VFPAGVVGNDDLIYLAGRSTSSLSPYRTSGQPAPWSLVTIEAVSPVTDLVVGKPHQEREREGCLSPYAVSKAMPRWRCRFDGRCEHATREIPANTFGPEVRLLTAVD
jgi:hypothetical protein